MIDPASVGPAGRAVRCARCKTGWFADGPKKAPEVTAFVAGVIAEAEAQSPGTSDTRHDDGKSPVAAGDFGSAPTEPKIEPAYATAPPQTTSPPIEPAQKFDVVPSIEQAPEPFTIADAPSLVPPVEHAPLLHIANAELDSEDADSFAARRQRLKVRRNEKRRSSRWTAVVLVLFAFNVALVGARSEVVRYLPQTASLFAAIGLPVNLRNLKFENVRISKEGDAGTAMLIVEGTIVSTGGKSTEVPRLRFAARNAAGQEVYSWTEPPSRSILGPGESLGFSSRIASPPDDASDVMVRFFNTQDTLPGNK